jgi:propionyl-CoA synthetase
MNNSSPYRELYNWSVTDPTSFWQGQAEAIHWQTPFHTVCDFTNPPFARWFVGGKTNLCYNAVDRHLETRDETATKQNGRSYGQPICRNLCCLAA